MKFKKAVCYTRCEALATKPDSHSGALPSLRSQEYAARKLAEKLDVSLEEYFCDIGPLKGDDVGSNFRKMVRFLSDQKERDEKPYLVIVHSMRCISATTSHYKDLCRLVDEVGSQIVIAESYSD